MCKVLDPGPSVPSPRALWGAHISSCMSGRMYLSRLCMYVTGFPISCTSQRSPKCHGNYHRLPIPDLNVPQCRTPGCTSHTHPPSVPPGLYQIASFSSSAPPRHHQASRACFFFCPQQDNILQSLLPVTPPANNCPGNSTSTSTSSIFTLNHGQTQSHFSPTSLLPRRLLALPLPH